MTNESDRVVYMSSRCIGEVGQQCKTEKAYPKNKIFSERIARHTHIALPLDVFEMTSPHQNQRNEDNHHTNDTEKRPKLASSFKGNSNVHTEDTAHKVEWHDDRGQESDLAKNTIGVCALLDIVDGQHGEVIAVGARKDLLEVTEVGCHRHNVVLDITQIHANVHAGRHLVIFVAALREATKDISFATKKTQERHDVLPSLADGPEKGAGIISAHDEHLVFDGIGLKLELMDRNGEGIDDIIT